MTITCPCGASLTVDKDDGIQSEITLHIIGIFNEDHLPHSESVTHQPAPSPVDDIIRLLKARERENT